MDWGYIQSTRVIGGGRRQFLRACVATGAAIVAPTPRATGHDAAWTSEISRRDSVLLDLRQEVAQLGNAEQVAKYRRGLAACAINPWLRSWISEPYEPRPNLWFHAVVEARATPGGPRITTLLDFHDEWGGDEQDDGDAPQATLGFREWLDAFRPSTRDDYLMALPLYWECQQGAFGDRPLPELQPTPDPWIDALLGGTRGMLVWRAQLHELIRLATCARTMSSTEAHQLVRGYLMQKPDALDCLKRMHSEATGQSLLNIINERNPRRFGMLGSPDYLAGAWLQRYQTALMGHVGPSRIRTI